MEQKLDGVQRSQPAGQFSHVHALLFEYLDLGGVDDALIANDGEEDEDDVEVYSQNKADPSWVVVKQHFDGGNLVVLVIISKSFEKVFT